MAAQYGPPVSQAPGMSPPGSDPNWSNWISPTSWEVGLLQRLAWPITHTTVTALDLWTLSEDSTGGLNGGSNPLAISGMFPGATKCIAQCGTASPIMDYATLQDGLNATAAFITNNSGYAGVIASFKNATYSAEQTGAGEKIGGKTVGNTGLLSNIFDAINQSGWCAGCQNGAYPTRMASFLSGQGLSAAEETALGHADQLLGTPTTGYNASQQGAATPTSLTPSLSSLTGALGTVLGDITSATWWERVGLFALGAVLVIGGTVVFMKATGLEPKALPV